MNISTRYTSIELVPKYNNHSLGYVPVTVNITGEIRGVFVVYENFCGGATRFLAKKLRHINSKLLELNAAALS